MKQNKYMIICLILFSMCSICLFWTYPEHIKDLELQLENWEENLEDTTCMGCCSKECLIRALYYAKRVLPIVYISMNLVIPILIIVAFHYDNKKKGGDN